jgi:hypothetical protein
MMEQKHHNYHFVMCEEIRRIQRSNSYLHEKPKQPTNLIFKITHDLEWERRSRPLKVEQCFDGRQCKICQKNIKGGKKRHFNECTGIDLYNDPMREDVTTYNVRPWRFECKKCQQRFNIRKKDHKCSTAHKYLKKKLCIYCDRYFYKIWTHRRKCGHFMYYDQHKTKIKSKLDENRRIFRKRLPKLAKVYTELRTHKDKVKFYNKFMPRIPEKQKPQIYTRNYPFLNYNPTLINDPVHTNYMFLDEFPRKPIENWTEDERYYWSEIKKVNVAYVHARVQLTREEKAAAHGLMSPQVYLSKKVYGSLRYNREMSELKVKDSKSIEREIFNKHGQMHGICKNEDGVIEWIPQPINYESDEDSILACDTPVHEKKINLNLPAISLKLEQFSNNEDQISNCSDVEEPVEFPMIVELPNLTIKNLTPSNEIVFLHEKCFPNIKFNDIKLNVDNSKSTGCFIDGEMVGALTFVENKILDYDFVFVVLLSVEPNHQKKKIGTELLTNLKTKHQRIVLWADNGCIKFYKKNAFKRSKLFWYSLQPIVPHCSSSTFHQFGFSEYEIYWVTKAWKNKQI